MEEQRMVQDAMNRLRQTLHRTLPELSEEQLYREPQPCIAWLTWHLARVQDRELSAITGTEQEWTANGWHARFDMPADPTDYAPGHVQTPELCAAFRAPDRSLLLDYFDAVADRMAAYLKQATGEELARVLDEGRGYDPKPTVGVRLVSILMDNVQHLGQISYLSGLHREGGWFPRRAG